jgi:hypothetical protein
VLDADVRRVVEVSTGSELQDSSRHPLWVLLARPLATALAGVLGDRFLAVLLLSAGLGAAAAAASFAVFRRRLPVADALLFAALLAASASVWFLSALPETFSANHLAIVLAFLLQDARFAMPRRHAGRFLAYAAYSVAALGATLTNFVYAGLGQLANVVRRGGPRREQAGVFGAYLLLCALLFAGLVGVEILLAPGIESYLVFDPSGLARLDAPFIEWGRRPALGDLAALVRSFLADNLLAPGPRVLLLDTTRGPQQLIQLVERGRVLYGLGALALAALVLGLAVTCRSFVAVLRSPGSLLAVACIGFNLVLHYFYRGHGQQFLYSIHAAFPLLLLLAQLYAASGWRWRRGVLALALVAVFANNLEAARGLRALLDRECAHETTRPREPCREWR